MTTLPDFHDENVLREHIATTMAFYDPRSLDPDGGFYHYYKDDGTVYDRSHRHLVSSTRFVFNNAMASIEFDDPQYIEATRHGLKYLREVHRNPQTGGYAWTLRDGKAEDTTNHCYGVAFVLLAYSTAVKAGVLEALPWMDETWELLEKHFFEAGPGLYRDEADANWNFSSYRGQNANMHMCEAMLAAYEASQDRRYLDRALLLADHMTRRQAAKAEGLVWEHYDIHWNVDWDYNKDNPKHLFRPWGFQPGHQTEWAKLLMILDRFLGGEGKAPAWLLPTARHLFDEALKHAWDDEFGGIAYGFAPDGPVCDDDKYFWVQAESLAAAALLSERSGDPSYATWYDKIWAYSWEHMVDHQYGAWFRILTRDNRKYDNEKSPAGKTDYHTMGAAYEVIAAMRRGWK